MTNITTANDAPVALITGAAKRLGACTARALHRLGYDIVIHHHTSTEEAQALAAELNQTRAASATTLCQDLSQAEAGAAIMAAVTSSHQPARALFLECACRAVVARATRCHRQHHRYS
jgi:pteridine reductase